MSVGWQELCREHAFDRAHAVAITIAAMEFPVRLVDLGLPGAPEIAEPEDATGPFGIMVRAEHRADLAEVVGEIDREQAEFDARLDERSRRVARWRQVVLLAIVLIVSVLALLGWLER